MQVRLAQMATVATVAAALAAVGPAAAQSVARPAVRTPTVTAAAPRVPLAPAPAVSDWSPRGQAYPGQTLTIHGRDFAPDAIAVRLGTGGRSVALPIVRATAAEIRVSIPEEYTGWEGAPLVVQQRGRESRQLDADYRILQRDAVFTGTSLWHVLDSPTSDIFARGQVTLRLERLEFAESGGGTYGETVRLATRVRRFEESCTTEFGETGKRDVEEWGWETHRPSRRITWRRLPDGRLELRDIGLGTGDDGTNDVTASAGRETLRLQYSATTSGPHRAPYTKRSSCRGILGAPPTVIPGYATPEVSIRGVPLRRTEWTLARRPGS